VRRFLARRLAHGAAVIFIAASLSFFLVHLAPGDPFSSTLDSTTIDPATKAAWREAYGLDRPLPEQYVRFLGQLATGNLGPSLMQPRPAADVLADAIPNTLLLMGAALVLSFVSGLVVGTWQASRPGSRADRAVGTASLVVASLPEFWLGVVLLLLFSYHLRVFPAAGTTDLVMHDSMSFIGRLIDRARHLALPALTLGLLGSASVARYQRAAVLEVLPQDYVRTARAKGMTNRLVLWRHALRNALVPTIVLLGLSLPTLLGGAVFVEQVFSWPGMGQIAAKAFSARDYHVVVGATVMGSVLVVVGGILTDVLHAAVDPRVRVR
jgi:ABC-type dipeptide/oligopeptide/nickel transport system permease component